MQIIDIKEAGNHNTLMWAIRNGANIKEDLQIQSIINGEVYYLVTLADINFFEMFRLSQMYRDKLRIIDVASASIPDQNVFLEKFPGEVTSGDESAQIGLLMEHACKSFYNIALQMTADNDIIQTGTASMYLPMITRNFTVQIPVDFMDFIGSMSLEESQKIYTTEYPNTLSTILESELHGVKTIISMGFVKSTSPIRYNQRFDKYLQRIKYTPLKSYKGNEMYKFALLGFSKYNSILRSDIKVSMFQPDKNELQSTMKLLANLNTPLKLEVVVQLPIHEWAILYSSYSREDLTIMADSSIADILTSGIIFSNFVAPPEDPEEEGAEAITNGIDMYKARIAEANQITSNAINIALESQDDIDVPAVFAMLPGAYSAKGVLTIDTSKENIFTSHTDRVLSSMFESIMELAKSVKNDIAKIK